MFESKISKPRSILKTVIFENKLLHGAGRGGGRKGPKQCHVLFEWPLSIF